jgi:hypothetical protein
MITSPAALASRVGPSVSWLIRPIASGWRALAMANRPLAFTVLAMLVLLAGYAVGLAVDSRLVTGAPVWLKPAKFAVSIAVYTATLAWLLSFLANRRLVAVVSWTTAVLLLGEMVLVTLQAARGTTSHFNDASEFDAALFQAMGVMIAVVWLVGVATALALWRHRFADPALGRALRLGVVVSLFGMAVAVLMTLPAPGIEPAPLATGGHGVGVVDGGPGLPVVGWSTVGGDLRIPHFVGIHALQLVPLLAWALARFGPAWLAARDRARLVGVGAAGYLGLTLLLTWQALRAQPLLAPDGDTLAALGALVAAVGVAAAVVVAVARRRRDGDGNAGTAAVAA